MLRGRARALAALARLSHRRPLVLHGEAGIGKTWLLRTAATSRGGPVFEGGGLASLSWMPYVPLMRAFEEEPPHGQPATVASWVLRRVGAGVLVLDDLHWADADTLSLLPALAGRISLSGAVRRGDPGAAAALSAAEAAGFEVLQVDGLPDTDADALLRELRPALAAGDRRRVIEQAGGNPLLLRELSSSPESAMTLRLGLGARLHRCSPQAREGMELLALLGRPAEPSMVPGAAELLDAGLVVDGDALAPRHEVLAELSVEALTPSRKRMLHARLARQVADPGEAARHHLAARERAPAPEKALELSAGQTGPVRRQHVHGAPTPRQREVLALVARGHTSAAIASQLGISRATVETHIAAAKAALHARTRAQAAALAAERAP